MAGLLLTLTKKLQTESSMNKLIIFLLAGGLAFFSCSRKSALISGKKNRLEGVDPSFEYLSSKAKFKFEHNHKKISATTNFRIRKDSIIWLSITPGLGIEIARALITRDRIFVLDKLNRKYHQYNFIDLSRQYGFEFSFDLIQSIALGNLVIPYANEKLIKTPSHFSYRTQKGNYNFQSYIGTSSMKLEKVYVTDDFSKKHHFNKLQ